MSGRSVGDALVVTVTGGVGMRVGDALVVTVTGGVGMRVGDALVVTVTGGVGKRVGDALVVTVTGGVGMRVGDALVVTVGGVEAIAWLVQYPKPSPLAEDNVSAAAAQLKQPACDSSMQPFVPQLAWHTLPVTGTGCNNKSRHCMNGEVAWVPGKAQVVAITNQHWVGKVKSAQQRRFWRQSARWERSSQLERIQC